MADFYSTFSALPQYRLHMVVTQGTQNIPGNYTNVPGSVTVEKLSGGGYFTGNSGNSGSISGDISVSAGGWAPYDFTAYSSRTIGSGSGNVTHNPDGTKTASGSYAASDSAGGNMGSASGSWALGLTAIPRGPQVEFDGVWAQSQVQVEFDGAWAAALMQVEFDGAWTVAA